MMEILICTGAGFMGFIYCCMIVAGKADDQM